ncbi:Tn3 family transposase [Streptosporangium minutum]|uniref:Tn3 transposase DDE domain-containing protein n=1 Tax=Streptosporangium minutum TaxID=569862 RepID=A0A243RSQ1_9ACTN|nr:Tn3 family transposase [Streptosporangium minutum]OUC98031.1 hypothetical protein CA984_08820 [Streptosporangium minutum]
MLKFFEQEGRFPRHAGEVPKAAVDQVPSGLTGMVADKPIDWKIIAQQYDQMVKYATALRLGTAEAEQVLRRFTRGGPKHPTYKAIEELGKAVKSIFVAEYVTAPELRRKIHEDLQVVGNWNSANTDLFYGSAGTLPGSDKEHQEVSMLSLRLLQSALVFINTLLVQSVLKGPSATGALPWNHATARRVPPFAAAPSAHVGPGHSRPRSSGARAEAQKTFRPALSSPVGSVGYGRAGVDRAKKQRPVAGATGCGMHRQGARVGRRCARGFDGDLWALSQLVAAAGQVGGLGGVAGQLNSPVVGRA